VAHVDQRIDPFIAEGNVVDAVLVAQDFYSAMSAGDTIEPQNGL
jgi:hypothetical protein